jgi:hypothetical protein
MSAVSTIILAFGRINSRVGEADGLREVGTAAGDRAESSSEARGRG